MLVYKVLYYEIPIEVYVMEAGSFLLRTLCVNI